MCSFEDYSKFFTKYFRAFSLYQNPIACNCITQQRLIKDTYALLEPTISPAWDIYCASPDKYKGFTILNFDNCKITVDGYEHCDNSSSPIFIPKESEFDNSRSIKNSPTLPTDNIFVTEKINNQMTEPIEGIKK